LRRRGDAPPPSPVKARNLEADLHGLHDLHTNHVQRLSTVVGCSKPCISSSRISS
jgi:hypothetical protein